MVEQDEIDEPTQVPIALQDAPDDANFASISHDIVLEDYPPVIMVFWDDDRHRYEVELSHDQEGTLCMLWDEQYSVRCIFLSMSLHIADDLDRRLESFLRRNASVEITLTELFIAHTELMW